MTYKIIKGNTVQEIEQRVNKMRIDGWMPIGGVQMIVLEWRASHSGSLSADTVVYIQAVGA